MSRLPDRDPTPPEACTKDGDVCEACDGTGEITGPTSDREACAACSGTIESTDDCTCDDCRQERRDEDDREGQNALDDAHARGLIRED